MTTSASKSGSGRRSPGEVRDAIVNVMREAGTPLTVGAIRAGVIVRLGSDVSASSVRSYLNLNCDAGSKFERVGRGCYRLRK